jgi:hypothetical protein
MEIRSASALTGLKVEEKNKEKSNQPASKAPATANLGQAVRNNESASAALTQLSHGSASREVGEANQEASRASVRDVEKAAEVANDVANQISQNSDQALKAQANQEPEKVETLLR